MMQLPVVSVICLCYNHKRFVEEAIRSVLAQTYPAVEIIVVDDASTDDSAKIITKLVGENPSIKFLPLQSNLGNCKAFNRGLTMATGSFIIDFSTDDVMLPERIARQVDLFYKLDESYGVVFTDAVYINARGRELYKHYEYLFSKRLLSSVPEGDVYQQVLSTYFISSPTMMSRRTVFDALKGYDEELVYEDFDFWVRSARIFKYAFLNEITTHVRRSAFSMSTGWYRQGDRQLFSTYLVCKKAVTLNKTREDEMALVKRLEYEIRQSVFSSNHWEASLFYDLLVKIGHNSKAYYSLHLLNRLKLPLSGFRKLYHLIRFGK